MPASEPPARTPHFDVRVEGASLPRAAVEAVLEWTVESSLHLPDLATLRVYDYGFHWLDSNLFQEGHPIEIDAGWSPSDLKTIFRGEIVGMELDLAAHHSATLVVRAYDLSHRLHRGRRCRPFVDTKDSDVVRKIAEGVGLPVDAKPTPLVREWILQNNQTDWEFLCERARRNGYDLFMKEGRLHFLPAGERREFARIELDWGQELRSFRPRTRAAGQVETVEVRGWDPKSKQKIVAHAKKPKGVPKTGGDADGAKWAKRFGASKTTVVDQPVHSVEEAEILAQSVRDQIGQDFLTADGLCDGAPGLMAGVSVEIRNIGQRFSGSYYVTAATHTYSHAEGYATQFEMSGTQPDSLLSLLEDAKDVTASPIGGNLVIGVVTDNRDPEGLGRVKVKYPWMADELASGWARIVSQMAGKGRGMFNLPEIEDEVLVAFEHGDPTRPYVLGQLWNGKDKPPTPTDARTVRPPQVAGKDGDSVNGTSPQPSNNPEVGGDGKVNRRGLYSRIGHLLDIDDTGGKGGVIVKTAGGNKIDASDADKKVEIKTAGGHTAILDDTGQMIELKTTSGHTITMSDAGNNIAIVDNAGDRIDMVMGAVSITALLAVAINAPLIALNAGVMLTGHAGGVVNLSTGIPLAGSTNLKMKVDGTITAEGIGDITLKSAKSVLTHAEADVKTDAGSNMDLKAITIKLNS